METEGVGCEMSWKDNLEHTHSKTMNKTLGNLGRHLILIVGALTILIPFLWMITTSLQTKAETYTAQSIFPTSWHWENYLQAWQNAPFGRFYINSLIMSVGIVVGHLIFDSLAAFAFARLKFPAKNILFSILLAGLMVPIFVTVLDWRMCLESFCFASIFLPFPWNWMKLPEWMAALAGKYIGESLSPWQSQLWRRWLYSLSYSPGMIFFGRCW